jgi:hypothetical protein
MIVVRPLPRRELDMAGSMKRQHQAAGNHLARHTVLLSQPVPVLAQPAGQVHSVKLWMCRDHLSDELDIRRGDVSPAIAQHCLHALDINLGHF